MPVILHFCIYHKEQEEYSIEVEFCSCSPHFVMYSLHDNQLALEVPSHKERNTKNKSMSLPSYKSISTHCPWTSQLLSVVAFELCHMNEYT